MSGHLELLLLTHVVMYSEPSVLNRPNHWLALNPCPDLYQGLKLDLCNEELNRVWKAILRTRRTRLEPTTGRHYGHSCVRLARTHACASPLEQGSSSLTARGAT